MSNPQIVGSRPKLFADFLREEGSETELYAKRRDLVEKPVEDWTQEDVALAETCGFPWLLWMQLIDMQTPAPRLDKNQD